MSAEGNKLDENTDRFNLRGSIMAKAQCGAEVKATVVFHCTNGLCLAQAYSENPEKALDLIRATSLLLLNKDTQEGRGGHIFDSGARSELTVTASGTVCGIDCPYIPPGKASRTLNTPELGIKLSWDEQP